jgi:ABC-type uncharacterized transport system involved in gliding motility auxiliary subunit
LEVCPGAKEVLYEKPYSPTLANILENHPNTYNLDTLQSTYSKEEFASVDWVQKQLQVLKSLKREYPQRVALIFVDILLKPDEEKEAIRTTR